jgi:ABC-type nitrate/sulfonate/bicarbonate transport system permease component
MVVRIRFGKGPKVERKRGKNRRVALACASLLTPAAVMAAALALWRLAADLQWAGNFAIPSGLFSHWQVWLASSGLLQSGSHFLNRYGRAGDQVG